MKSTIQTLTRPFSALALAAVLVLFGLFAPSLSAGPPFPGRTPANKLTASDSEDDDRFGSSVSISGNLAIAGAQFESRAGNDRGAA